MNRGDLAELRALADFGRKFRNQQHGRRPGALSLHIRATVTRVRPATFEDLLTELEFQALRNRTLGGGPILRVDRQWETVRYLDGATEREVTFKRLQNLAQLRKSRLSVTRESAA
ncbi:hypothetical protein AZOA_07370 [Azoarcus sp. Aa7]|nr:hypothetical protein [Azoarcus sp. Aa7]